MAEAEKPFDLTRYRTEEVAVSVSKILCLDRIFLTWLRWLAVVLIVFVIIVFLVFHERLGEPWIEIITTYAIVGGFCYGGLVGLCRVLTTALSHISELVRLMINVVRHAADDFRKSQSGEQRLPKAGELFKAAYRDVMLPIMENVLAEQYWIVGKPILWVYRRSLGRLIDYLITIRPADQFESEDATELHQAYTELAAVSAENEEAFEQRLLAVDQIVMSFEGRLRRWALRPMYAITAAFSLVLTGPLILVYYLL